MNKDIYRIIDTTTNEIVATGFATRQAAKPKRDELNKPSEEKSGKPAKDRGGRYIVSRGKDHPRGPSDGTTKNTYGKKSGW